MQFDTQGQWWSILITQRPHRLQWWVNGGLTHSHYGHARKNLSRTALYSELSSCTLTRVLGWRPEALFVPVSVFITPGSPCECFYVADVLLGWLVEIFPSIDDSTSFWSASFSSILFLTLSVFCSGLICWSALVSNYFFRDSWPGRWHWVLLILWPFSLLSWFFNCCWNSSSYSYTSSNSSSFQSREFSNTGLPYPWIIS